eukprot:1158882-Pelagomonas_calceolata.AAC.6
MQVPGSVEKDRLFSKLAFIKDERCNRPEAEHLNVCLILATQHTFSFVEFPFISAMRKWFAAKGCRPAAVPRQPLQPRQPVVIEIDSGVGLGTQCPNSVRLLCTWAGASAWPLMRGLKGIGALQSNTLGEYANGAAKTVARFFGCATHKFGSDPRASHLGGA